MKSPNIPLQVEATSNYQWEKLLENKKLLVVDVYSEWCGPCKSMIPIFEQLKKKVGDGISFATANAEKISVLEKFRGKSEPTWLLLADGKIINVVYGSNPPKLLDTISSELKKENLILSGEDTRTELEIDDIPKEEPALTRPPPSEQPKEQPPPPPVNPFLLDEEFPYRPFRVTYYK